MAEVHNERNDTENVNDSQIMTIFSTILENQKKQEKIGSLSNKITNMENELQESQYDYDFKCYDDQTYDENSNVQRVENNVENSDNTAVKRKCDQIEIDTAQGNQSRFSNMSKRFKSREICDVKIDETLASNITDLFRNGMNEEQNSDLIKDENNARPDNCEGLEVVKTNQNLCGIFYPQKQEPMTEKCKA